MPYSLQVISSNIYLNTKERKMLTAPWLVKPVAASGWTPIKQVINGRAYNTETSRFIHEYLDNDTSKPRHSFGMEQFPYAEQMFRTRFGKFFLILRNEPHWNPAIDELDLQDRVIPVDPEQAIKWMEKYCNEKIADYVDVPEAGEPSTTLTLRLDKVLKIFLNAAAVHDGVSMNLWCVRALEAALKENNQKEIQS